MALVAIAISLAPALVAETRVEVSTFNKDVRASDSTWRMTDVVIDDDVLSLTYGGAWKNAYAKPNEVITEEGHWVTVRDGLFYKKVTEVIDTGIKYDVAAKHIQLVHNVNSKPDTQFNLYLIFLLLSVVLVTIGLVKYGKYATPQGLGFFFAILAAADSINIEIGVATCFFAFFAAALLIVGVMKKNPYWFTTIALYYLSAAVSLIFFFRS